jgi:hypothetical protein
MRQHDCWEFAREPGEPASTNAGDLGTRCRHEFFGDRKYLARIYRPPEDLSFANSQAFFPDAELKAQLAGDYETQCRLLFSGPGYPAFDEVLARFEEIRNLL